MNAYRWANILELDREYAAGKDRLSGRPLEAYIEVAARCNLRCQMCPITVDPRYDPGSGLPGLLSRELFDRLEPCFPSLRRAYLFGLGEPLLHPDLVEFTERLASAGVEVWITTNGTLIGEERAAALARAGLAHVTVSIDGATPETYERIRRRGRFEDVVQGLRALGAARRRFGRPEVFVSLVAMRSNLHELPQLVELCAEAGGDGIFVEGLYPYAHPAIEEFCDQESLLHLGRESIEESLNSGERRAEELGIAWVTRMEEQAMNRPHGAPAAAAHGVEGLSLPWACSEPWQTINVNASGEVRPCCFNDDVLGTLAEQTLGEIWNGEKYAELRREQAAGIVRPGCATCVRNGRVKRSPYLGAREEIAPSAKDFELLVPAEGDLIADPVVLVGRWVGGRETLPELWVDQHRACWLGDFALVDRQWFAAVVPLPYVTEGAHSLSFRQRGGELETRWGARRVQRGEVPRSLAAFARLAIPIRLSRYEQKPTLRMDGRSHPIERWFCGIQREGWLGVAVIALTALPPGAHEAELCLKQHAVFRQTLTRLSLNDWHASFPFPNAPATGAGEDPATRARRSPVTPH